MSAQATVSESNSMVIWYGLCLKARSLVSHCLPGNTISGGIWTRSVNTFSSFKGPAWVGKEFALA